jgi:hypothetical protein
MKIEVTVLVDVPEHPKQWNFLMADALRDIATEIYLNPKAVHSKGESLYCTYEYTVQGRE